MKDILHIGWFDILAGPDIGEVLAEGKEEITVVEFQETGIVAGDAEESPVGRRQAFEADGAGLGLAPVVFQAGEGGVEASLGGGETGLPDAGVDGVIPIGPAASLIIAAVQPICRSSPPM